MASAMQIIENRRVRGCILRWLLKEYPRALKVGAITKALLGSRDINSPDIAVYLDYLEGKEYIAVFKNEKEERSPLDAYTEEMLVKLEWRGMDLLEGAMDDPGVDI